MQLTDFADADGHRRRARLVIAQHIEMMIEGRDLIGFGHRNAHLFRQRMQPAGGNAAFAVLNEMQIFDQQIAAARPISQKRADGLHIGFIELAPFGKEPPAPARATHFNWIFEAHFANAYRSILMHANTGRFTARAPACSFKDMAP